MKLYESGKLIHVDSSKDIIKHFGVKGYNDRGSYNIRKDGKKVGELYVDNLGKGELNVNWVSVKKKYHQMPDMCTKKLGYKEGKTTKAEGWETLTDMRKEIR